MTVLAAYLPEKGGRATLQLATVLARGLGVPLAVATVAPKPFDTSRREDPDGSGADAQFGAWSAGFAARAETSARAHLAEIAPGTPVQVHHRSGRSVSGALVDLAADVGAALLVLGSSPEGHLGQVTVGSTAGRLLHSSPLPVALAPRGYRAPRALGGGRPVSRLTCAATGEDDEAVVRAQALAKGFEVPLRVVTLAVRGSTVWPSVTAMDAEEQVLAAWRDRAERGLAALRSRRGLGADVETVVGTGRGWREAVDSVDWEDGELLVVGTRPEGPVARVFLGSHATKIVRHAPVPVVVLAG